MTKTSISLDENILKGIDDFRRIQPKIPKVSEAIRDLLKKGLRSLEESNTDIPQNTIKFESKTVSIEKNRGRFVIRFNPSDLEVLKKSGWAGNKVDVWIAEAS